MQRLNIGKMESWARDETTLSFTFTFNTFLHGLFWRFPKNIWTGDETALSLTSLLSIFLHGLFWRSPKKYLSQRWNSTCTEAFPFWPWLWLQYGWACWWKKKKCAVAQVGDENSWDSTMGYMVQVFLGDFPHFWLKLTLPFVIFRPDCIVFGLLTARMGDFVVK